MQLFTTDISAEECIYDLIDNSVDAARQEIQTSIHDQDEYGLPSSYKGYKVQVDISSTKVTITDNCKGVSKADFENSTFIIGQRSVSDYSIGFYGIGLKRALLKLGNKYSIVSDDGKHKITFNADRKTLSQSTKKAKAQLSKTSKTHSVQIHIEKLDIEIKQILSNKNWRAELKEKISRRYGIFINKGLSLKIDGQILKGIVPKIRKKGPVPLFKDSMSDVAGVDIYIQTGSHIKYKMRHETGFSQASNTKLTPEFGWYVVCNDRIMIVADKSKSIGLTSNWHSEYNGFIGWVYFIAKDASDLPWNTKKTQIVMESPSFMKAKGLLQAYTDDWKKKNKAARPKKPTPKPQPRPPSITPGGGKPKPKPKPKPIPKPILPLASPPKIDNLTPDADIYAKLQKLNIVKLRDLYYSITSVKLEYNTPLIAVGIWSFLESLAALGGKKSGTSFSAFWSQSWAKKNGLPHSASNKEYKGQLDAMTRLQDAGNITKHDAKSAAYNGEQLNNDLSVMKNIIEKSIDIAIANK